MVPGLVVVDLVVVGLAVAVAYGVSRLVPVAGPLTVALLLGIGLANSGRWARGVLPGVARVGKRSLRAGVVLLGLQLAVDQVITLGAGTLLVIVAGSGTTFALTRLLGPRLGVSPRRSLLVATGVSICGASAVAAMEETTSGDDDAHPEDAATAVAIVTLYGSLAIALYPLLLPLLTGPLGLGAPAFGAWAGASVHEVAQVVAIGSAAGGAALGAAVLVKLGRVVLLAPLVAGVSLTRRRTATAAPAGTSTPASTGTSTPAPDRAATGPPRRSAAPPSARAGGRRTPLVPLFVVGFLAAMAVRSAGLLPEQAVPAATTAASLALAGGMFGLGAGVDLRAIVRGGGRAVLLGGIATLLLMAITLAGLALVHAR
ncbi:MAG: putative sulfate exporter family transporter [Streptosporangiales bacterium]|nr:putative sulfate exporter family transporter [Streptosporangiales bacterium]